MGRSETPGARGVVLESVAAAASARRFDLSASQPVVEVVDRVAVAAQVGERVNGDGEPVAQKIGSGSTCMMPVSPAAARIMRPIGSGSTVTTPMPSVSNTTMSLPAVSARSTAPDSKSLAAATVAIPAALRNPCRGSSNRGART